MRVLGMAGALLCLLLSVSPALCGKRVALVLGNSEYKHAPQLTNPRNDATDVSGVLRQLGLTVIDGFDLDKAGLEQKVREFATALQGAEVGILFYAGHGLQVAGQNYLVPVDAKLSTAAALDFEMIRLDVIQRIMEGEASTNILFLDACRDNPLARNLARAMGTRSTSIGRGLASVESGSGTLISFSTQPGNVALDGDGRNSPFTSALVRHLAASKDDLSSILIAVRNDVMSETQRKQVPWEHSALTRRFFFSEAVPAAATAPPETPGRTQVSEASLAWQLVKDSSDARALEAFRRQYGAGNPFFDRMAEVRLDELTKRRGSPVQQKNATSAAFDKAHVPSADQPSAWRPARPITLVVPFAAGGLTDTIGRLASDHLTRHLGQPVIVENVPGGGGLAGAAKVAAAQSDGHTILIHANALAAVPSLQARPPIDVRTALEPIGLLAFAPLLLVARKDLGAPADNPLGWVQSNAAKLSIATLGLGSGSHTCALLIQQVLKRTLATVPYKTSASVLADLAAGTVDLFCDHESVVGVTINGGLAVPLSVLGRSRLDNYPTIASAPEQGWTDGIAISYFGLWAPRGTPRDVVTALNSAMQKAAADKEFSERLDQVGLKPFAVRLRPAAEHAKLFETEIERQSSIYKSAGVKPQ